MQKNIHSGLIYLLDGFILICKPDLRIFVILSMCLNLVLFVGLFWISHYYFSEFSHWLQHFLPSWLRWTGYILQVIFLFVFFMVFLYTFATVANLAGAPFNNLLAEKVAKHLTGKNSETSSTSFATSIIHPARRQLSVLFYYLPRAVALLMLSFIPMVQFVSFLLWVLFSAWFMTLQCVDYCADNQRIPFFEMREKLAEKWFLSLTFGLSVLFFLMVPVLNLFVVPAAVAGATKLWIENFSRLRISPRSKRNKQP